MGKKLTKEEFIKKARSVHGDKYGYDKVEYYGVHTKVCIICPEHGDFWQSPGNHLHGNGCPKCGYNTTADSRRLSLSDFIKKANEIHNCKYDYNKVDYKDSNTKVCIICSKHGEFWQKPASHTQGRGCPKCYADKARERLTSSKEDFIKKAKEKHEGKYDYTKVKYDGTKTKVCIICSKHGEFWQSPGNHLQGRGCPKCANETTGERCRSSLLEFIKKANEKHGGKYDYDKVDYVNCDSKVCIICSKHGKFWQTPSNHLHGKGCPKCNLSHLERDVMNYLDGVGITYIYQKHFDWLGRQSLDFYLPDYNVGIECQGGQHFFPVEYFGGEDGLIKRQKYDKRKKKICEKHGVKLLYFGNTSNYDTFLGETVHDDVQFLIDYLNEHKKDNDLKNDNPLEL